MKGEREMPELVVNPTMGVYFQSTPEYTVQEIMHQGKAHLVVPVTMMVEGVHSGSRGALLHPINELGRFPDTWNGIPIVINHPEVNGVNVSANSPESIEENAVGRVYHTKVNGTKIQSEAWFDAEKLGLVDSEVLKSIQNSKKLEVSVGVFSDEEDSEGEWNGEHYTKIAHNHRPDHLAILPDCEGACSIADGCGLGVNATVIAMEKKRADLKMGVNEFYAAPRNPPSESKLPIFDEIHLRNAMARFSQTKGFSAEEKISAADKIKAKCKELKIDSSGFEESLNANDGLRALLESASTAVRSMDTNNSYHYTEEVYSDYLIYSTNDSMGTKLYKQSYTLDNGNVKLEGTPVEVHRQVNYVEDECQTNTKKEVKMKDCPKCAEKINVLIANSVSGYQESDREWMMHLPEAALDRLVPKEVVKTVEVNKLTPAQEADLAFVAKQRAEKRMSLMAGIQANTSKETWPDAVLTELSEEMLERVHSSVQRKEEVADYSFIGGGANFNANSSNEEPLLPVV